MPHNRARKRRTSEIGIHTAVSAASEGAKPKARLPPSSALPLGVALGIGIAFLFLRPPALPELPSFQGSIVSTVTSVLLQSNATAHQPPVEPEPWFDPLFDPDEHRKGVQYGYKDFVRQFGVIPLHKTIVDSAVAALVAAHDIRQDPAYLNEQEEVERMAAKYGALIEEGTANDDRFYAAWTGPEKGYGMFPRVPIKAGDCVGVYAGVITNGSMASAYAWGYNSDRQIQTEYDPDGLGLVVDSEKMGNMLRFANHESPEPNTEAQMVPYKNLWHVLYIAKRDIAPHEEVTISYGDSYWEALGYDPVLKAGEAGREKHVVEVVEVVEVEEPPEQTEL